MSLRPKKRSLTLRGHATSVSLEDPFWAAFREIAMHDKIPITTLAERVDEMRDPQTGLATAIRVFVLEHYRGIAQRNNERGYSGAT